MQQTPSSGILSDTVGVAHALGRVLCDHLAGAAMGPPLQHTILVFQAQ